MSTINYEQTAQRAISNAMYLTEVLLANSHNQVHQQPETRWIANRLVAWVNNALAIEPNPSSGELKAFVKTCCAPGIGVNPPQINAGYLNDSLIFDLNSMNPYFRNIAAKLVEPNELQDSLLYNAHKIAVLNRKLCALAEEIVEKHANDTVMVDGVAQPMTIELLSHIVLADGNEAGDTATDIGIVWYRAQCARSGTFDHPFNRADYGIDNYRTTPITQLDKAFAKAQASRMCPFNKKVHRLRMQGNSGSSQIANNERYLLSIGAGAAKTQIAANSTLGLVERALGLPERCDISGTTTDAVGASWEVSRQGNDCDNRVYILCCMTSMLLLGHHSLDEMGGACSLSVAVPIPPVAPVPCYNPLNPVSLFYVLNALGNVPLQQPAAPNMIAMQWFSNEWLVLSGYDSNNIAAWNFTDDNWRVWKMFANVVNAQPAP